VPNGSFKESEGCSILLVPGGHLQMTHDEMPQIPALFYAHLHGFSVMDAPVHPAYGGFICGLFERGETADRQTVF
jgi:hypothetical protein